MEKNRTERTGEALLKRDIRSYLYRVAIVLVVVSVIPALLSSAYNTNLFMKQTVQLVHSKNETELTRTGTLMERTLQQIMDFANATVADARFANIQTATEQWKAWTELNKLRYANPFIAEYMLYNGSERTLLISNYGIERNPERSKVPWIVSEAPKLSLYQFAIKPTMPENGRHYASIVLKLPGPYAEPNYFLFQIDLDKIYRSFLNELNVNAELYDYYLTDVGGTILYHRNTENIGKPMSALERNEAQFQINRHKLAAFNWDLVGEVHTELLYKDVVRLKNKVISVLFAVVALMAVFIAIGARELYKPFRSLVSRFAESEELLRKSVLRRLVKGETPVDADTAKLTGGLSPHLLVAVIAPKPQDHTERSDEGTAALLLGVDNRLTGSFRAELFREPNGERLALFQLGHGDANRFVTELVLALDEEQLAGTVISVGGIHPLEDIHKSYIEAMYASNIGRIYTTDSQLYCYNKLPMDYESNLKAPAIDELELAIRHQNERSFTEALNVLFSGQLTVVEYNRNFYMAVSLLLRLFGQNSLSFLNELNRLITDKGIMNVTAVKQFLFAKFRDFRDYAEETKDYADKIREYTVRHYKDNFSLDDMAEHLGISKQHLITVCKKSYDRTPVEYINEYRIEEAKRLLSDPKTKIADIGTRSGFNSNSYFAKVFKQYAGITPSEYRELLSNREQGQKPHTAES
ncbi:MAG: two component transcriptional regulator, AraC family [Paenibacillus sp.]|nr:two component transcriptional regulator, AraC family [Paenibacillus sp.]